MTDDLALLGGSPVRGRPFPAWPAWDETEASALARVLSSGAWGSTSGRVVAEFEQEFAEFQHAASCVCVANGTLGLAAALHAAGVGPGDEVVVPAYTFVASASSVLFVGAVPVFADVRPETLLLDSASVEAVLTPRTKAVMPVHVAGRPCDMDALSALGRDRGLLVIEDAAQAHGAEWRGRRVGAIGDIGVFSFQSSKNMTAGEGGAIVTDDVALADMAYSMVNLGRVRGGAWYQHDHVGYNLRLTEFQGAILHAQLKRLPDQHALRTRNAARLHALLATVDGVRLLEPDPLVTAHAWHLAPFRVQGLDGGAAQKARFVEALAAEGVPCSTGYAGLHRNAALIRESRGRAPASVSADCPGTEQAESEVVWLPQHVLLGGDEDVHDIAAAIAKVCRHRRRL